MSTPVMDILRMSQILGERSAGEQRQSFVPPPRDPPRDRTDDLIAASLAGGMIAAGGKPITAEEAVQVWRGVREAMG